MNAIEVAFPRGGWEDLVASQLVAFPRGGWSELVAEVVAFPRGGWPDLVVSCSDVVTPLLSLLA